MKADTSHIQACRNAWLRHLDKCQTCKGHKIFIYRIPDNLCEQGAVLYDEYCAAISANRDCEKVIAQIITEADK